MNRKPSAIRWGRLPEQDKKRLLHLVAQWFTKKEKPLSHSQIGMKMRNWVRTNASNCYDPSGVVSTQFVGRRIADAAQKYAFLQVGRFYEQEVADRIQKHFSLVEQVIVAPDRHELLRYVWLYLDRILTERVKTNDTKEPVIVGVSGGRTMLALAKAAENLTDLTWHDEIPVNKRAQVIVCSLTSGGIRSNIAAMSDTVAAIIAQHLGAQVRGLLGPAWFADSSALTGFRKDPDVKEHIRLVKKADVILTSIGYLGDANALMRQLLDHARESNFAAERPNLADILYNCYNGLSGESVNLPKAIADHLFSVMNLEQLCEKVRVGSRCIVLAVGEEKGRYALPGIFKRPMASHVYMDRACAQGLVHTLP